MCVCSDDHVATVIVMWGHLTSPVLAKTFRFQKYLKNKRSRWDRNSLDLNSVSELASSTVHFQVTFLLRIFRSPAVKYSEPCFIPWWEASWDHCPDWRQPLLNVVQCYLLMLLIYLLFWLMVSPNCQLHFISLFYHGCDLLKLTASCACVWFLCL